ncbi:unknown [Fusobacterium nucleatum subsp. nucleatum ATCC 25586]|uniref:Uncharacterized protein n=1 Tax=Fusobacterium nucleatum subsp. nucleatum (strain ATCC 25586 / DSM 15643 / BCRC 10681 / CIP 101130 / JCM 8532 / KCTC 2640 / LMG 13131 / VPI 4355) TaxID=190304 RepID=Q8RIC0_FUSNN|nr:unknown [Fusobacterium nucleatum subsp. nucleatum ATCC 25586]
MTKLKKNNKLLSAKKENTLHTKDK